MRYVMQRLRWVALGAALVWIFDPARGGERRDQMREKAAELMRRTGEMTKQRGEEAAERLDEVADDIEAPADGGTQRRRAATSTG